MGKIPAFGNENGSPRYIEIQAIEDVYDELSAEERPEWLGAEAIEIAKLTRNQSLPLENAVEDGKRMLLAAQESFRLGVIGEFRVGKSTLINALVGHEVAFTDIMEATAAECLFHYGKNGKATINYKDGSTKITGVEEMNDTLDANREDKEWLNGIDHIAYSVDSDRLQEFDIWDAPGIGGDDDNERLANRFLEKLGGAIWVLDVTLIGKSSIIRPLSQLKKTGKPVVGVLNRIDEYDGNLDEAIEFLHKSYPDLFSTVITMSALDELDAVLDKNSSASIEKLWSIVLSTFGRDQDGGLETRLEMTIKAVNTELVKHVSALRQSVSDQIGLCEHIRFNLVNEKQRLLLNFPSIFKIHADRVFIELETSVWESLDSNDSHSDSRSERIEYLINELQQKRTYEIALHKIKDRVTEQISSDWFKATREAIILSHTAMALSGSPQKKTVGNSSVSHLCDGDRKDFDDISEEALDEAYYAGGISAVVAGTLAAVSASISWPVILVALPIGALAAWKKQKTLDRSAKGLGGQINQVLNQVKSELLSTYSSTVEEQLSTALDEEIESVVLRRIPIEVGVEGAEVLEESRHKLISIERKLGKEHLDDQDAFTPKNLLDELSQPGTRLDIIITEPRTSLAPILSQVAPDTTLRLILITNKISSELENVVENCFGNWQGSKKARAIICTSSPLPGDIRAMVISSEFAVQTTSSLDKVFQQNLSFSTVEDGRLAAQRTFAVLWDGRQIGNEKFDVIQLY